MEIGTEISHKIKTAIKTKLQEFGSYVDDELPDYILVMVANKRSQTQMSEDLNLFLGDNSKLFCEWLHDLLLKLQEVTEGAFEVKVPLKRKSTETKQAAKTDSDENETLKVSRISQKPSPDRITSAADEEKNKESPEPTTEGKRNSSKRGRSEKQHRHGDDKNTSSIQSAITVQKRPTLPASKQANPTLLKKAIQAAQVSTDSGEYNPEIPSTTQIPEILEQSAETKRIKREELLAEHKKLQRLKSQHDEETMVDIEPVIELQVAQDDDLFNTEEPTSVKDRRIVVEKSPEPEKKLETGKKEKNKVEKKEKKGGKRKADEEAKPAGQPHSTSGSDDDETKGKDKERTVKAKEKRKKPKFIVTLEGVGSKFEEKYEKEHSRRKKRRRSSPKDEEQPEINKDVPVMPVFPQLVHGVHQVPGMIPAQLGHAGMPPAPQQVHVLPQSTVITAPIAVGATVQDVPEDVEFDDVDDGLDKEKCRFWPQCQNGNDCPFYHPDVTCKHFPNCRYGKDCSYAHPSCKFGTRCTSTSCPYSHEETTESSESETLCRYHPFCTRANCPFLHPLETPCRYGKTCTRTGCKFKHSIPPSREQLKWVAPVSKVHLSERTFAVNEASTTALPVK